MESARRMRDVKVANELYLMLLNKAQELKVVKEGTIGNVRILDAAILPVEPVAPRRARVLALALFLGLAGGIGARVRAPRVRPGHRGSGGDRARDRHRRPRERPVQRSSR